MKKLIILVTVLLCVITLNSCDRKTPGNERPQDDYAVGDIVDGFTVVAAGDDGYLLREGLSEDGLPMWILDYDDDCLNTPTTVTSSNCSRFIAFLPDYYVHISDDRDKNPDILYIDAIHKYHENYILSYLEIPQDKFITIPLVERVRSEGNEVWFELRYYVAEDTPADEVVVYHLIPGEPITLEIVDSFE